MRRLPATEDLRTVPMDFNASTVFEEPAARKTDPVASHLAAKDAAMHASPGRLLALTALAAHGPMTDFELAIATNRQQTSIGKRRGECMRAGLVRPYTINGEQLTRPAPSGSAAGIYEITEAGRQFLNGRGTCE